MHPDNLDELENSGVFRLAMPADVGGYQADEQIIAEVLAQIARGCPSTGWMCAIILASNNIPAILADEVSDEVYMTPDLRISTAIAPTAHAVVVDGGYRVTGEWLWNTAGVHSNWFIGGCVVVGEEDAGMRLMLMRGADVQHRDSWHAMGMAGTATNTTIADDVLVPAARSILLADFAEGRYPVRRYSGMPYFNRPWLLFMNSVSAAPIVGIARGAMDCFMQTLPTRGAITSTTWSRAAEAPVLHHQLAEAQLDLDAAEMFLNRLTATYEEVLQRPATLLERVRARAYIGHIVSLTRHCVGKLFEASSSSHTLLSQDIQRYFRDISVMYQHANIRPDTGNETYGRVLAGLEPHTQVL
jgi:alkylation response protein AidB-like acyl-CoA dehydrogenase